jgi:hypothetical protein
MEDLSFGAGPWRSCEKQNPNETGAGYVHNLVAGSRASGAEQSFLKKGPGLPYPILPFSTCGL